jgi:hypothetical protein
VDQSNSVLNELKRSIQGYLNSHPRISLNGLSKRCAVSEPTFRRIMNDQVKTTPNPDTIVEILTTVHRGSKLRDIVEMYPGPIAELLIETFGFVAEEDSPYKVSDVLDQELAEREAYLIYKLAANRSGVTRAKVTQLFGRVGEQIAENLLEKELLEVKNNIYHATLDGFSLTHELFIRNFKALADFIDTNPNNTHRKNQYYNFSESVNSEGLKKVMDIQRMALKKILKF